MDIWLEIAPMIGRRKAAFYAAKILMTHSNARRRTASSAIWSVIWLCIAKREIL
jgi:hypothetical protein